MYTTLPWLKHRLIIYYNKHNRKNKTITKLSTILSKQQQEEVIIPILSRPALAGFNESDVRKLISISLKIERLFPINRGLQTPSTIISTIENLNSNSKLSTIISKQQQYAITSMLSCS